MNRQGQPPLRGLSAFGTQPNRSNGQLGQGQGQGRIQNGGSQSSWSFIQNGAPGLSAPPSRAPLGGTSFAQSLGGGNSSNASLDPSDFPSLSGSSPSSFANAATQAVWSTQRPHGLGAARAGNVAATAENRKAPHPGSQFDSELSRTDLGGGIDDFIQPGSVMRGNNPPAIDDFPPLGGLGPVDLGDQRLNLMQAAARGATSLQDDSLDQATSPLQDSQSGGMDSSRQGDGLSDQKSEGQSSQNMPKRDYLTDKYGLPEFLSRIRSRNPDVNSLSRGHDLTQLGMDLSSNEPLWPTWGSPFASQPARPLTPDFTLPACYKVGNVRPLQDKIANFNSETLFIIFYQMTSDVAQEYAAYELTHRNWRYHKGHKFWFGRSQGYPEPLPMPDGERGRYDIFNFPLMRREMRELYIKWADLDDHVVQAGPFAPVIA